AVSIIDAELSRPVISERGHRSWSTAVLLPGPHPRSMTVVASGMEIREARSWHGRVRSSGNFQYWSAFPLGIWFLPYDHRLSWTLHDSATRIAEIPRRPGRRTQGSVLRARQGDAANHR